MPSCGVKWCINRCHLHKKDMGISFHVKVPHLYWSGGDVVYDNGFGCYVQSGRRAPIGAENYHFPHSMPGLVSMRMTRDDEMCGIFHITFKPLPQFDLKNVVFGRVVRPSSTYEAMKTFGAARSTHPVVRIESARFIRGEALLDPPASHSSLKPPASHSSLKPPASHSSLKPPASHSSLKPPASHSSLKPPVSHSSLELLQQTAQQLEALAPESVTDTSESKLSHDTVKRVFQNASH